MRVLCVFFFFFYSTSPFLFFIIVDSSISPFFFFFQGSTHREYIFVREWVKECISRPDADASHIMVLSPSLPSYERMHRGGYCTFLSRPPVSDYIHARENAHRNPIWSIILPIHVHIYIYINAYLLVAEEKGSIPVKYRSVSHRIRHPSLKERSRWEKQRGQDKLFLARALGAQ